MAFRLCFRVQEGLLVKVKPKDHNHNNEHDGEEKHHGEIGHHFEPPISSCQTDFPMTDLSQGWIMELS